MFSLIFAAICTFIPPADWQMAEPKDLKGTLKIGFMCSDRPEFPARVTLASEEEVDGTLKEYVKAVKTLQKSDPSVKNWRDLGALAMQNGEGRLIEMESESPAGPLKILQAFYLENETVYFLTASTLKKDFAQYQTELLKTFRSLAVFPDLFSPIKDAAKKKQLTELNASLNSETLKTFYTEVQNQKELGPYWQYLALQEAVLKMGLH